MNKIHAVKVSHPLRAVDELQDLSVLYAILKNSESPVPIPYVENHSP